MGIEKFVKRIPRTVSVLAFLFFVGCKPDTDNGRTWSVYKGDMHSSNYSPLDQINVSNVSTLKLAWTFEMKDNAGRR
jgi:quinoprotein glucose dehydrogenase